MILSLIYITKVDSKALFFYPSRESLKKLIVNVNRGKDILKKNGIVVDGKRYSVKFKGARNNSNHL